MPPPAPPIGILLLNLGGPDTLDAVEPFLIELFSDREIIPLPGGAWLQPTLARLIARLRGPKVRGYYAQIGGGSPILPLTRRQATALEAELGRRAAASGEMAPRFRIGIAMRYWHPKTEPAVRELYDAGVRRFVALTLFPQFSHATTHSSQNELGRVFERLGPDVRLTTIDRYPDHPGYLDAMANAAEEGLRGFPEAEQKRALILFSAHGLPMSIVNSGDPYIGEMARTREGVLRLLRSRGWENSWKLGYQSRTGPVEWIRPYTDDVIKDLGREGVKSVLVVPLAFVSDHIETLYEIDLLYGDLAKKVGITDFRRSRSLNDDPVFIRALADLVGKHLEETGVSSADFR